MATQNTEHPKDRDLVQSIARTVLGGLEQMKDEIREDLVEETRASLEVEYQHRLEEELAQLGIIFRNGEIQGAHGEEGVFDLNDGFFASEAAQVFQNGWTPMAVKPGAGGKITTENVKESVITFLLGAPLGNDLLAGETSTSVVLRSMQAAEQRWKIDPNVRSAMRSFASYTLGNGITIFAANPDVDKMIKSYWKENNMTLRLMEAIPREFLLGEHYFQHYVSKDGKIYTMDRTKPYEIEKIVTHADDHLRTLAFGRTPKESGSILSDKKEDNLEWFPDINYYEQLQNDGPMGINLTAQGGRLSGIKKPFFNRRHRMQMIRSSSMGQTRGLSDTYSILRWLKYYEDFVTDRVLLNHERSKIVWVRVIKGSRGIPSGRAQRGPKGGQVLTETDQVQWKAVNAEINASDVTEDGRLIRLMISAGWGIPEHILFQDPSNTVYASIRQSDTPFSQWVTSKQASWEANIDKTFRFFLREKVAHILLPEEVPVEVFRAESINRIKSELRVMIEEGADNKDIDAFLHAKSSEINSSKHIVNVPTEEVKIRIEFPNIIQVDPLKKAQISEVLKRASIASSTTLAAEHGYDWEEEVHEISLERDQMLDLGLTDSKVIPFEKPRAPQAGKNVTPSPNMGNEPQGAEPTTDEPDNTDAS
jgi:hypothetical protein